MSDELKQEGMNKLLAGAIIALLSWNIWTTHSLAIDVAVLTEKVTMIEQRIAEK